MPLRPAMESRLWFRQESEVLGPSDYESMLKQISSLVLVLVVGSSVFAGGVRISREHVCNMAILNAGPNLETEPEIEVPHTSCMDMAGMDSLPEMEMTGMKHMTTMEMQHSEMPDQGSMSTIDMSGAEVMPCCKKASGYS